MPAERLIPPGCVFICTEGGEVRQLSPAAAAPLLALRQARWATPSEVQAWYRKALTA
jgi:hypothetical protein